LSKTNEHEIIGLYKANEWFFIEKEEDIFILKLRGSIKKVYNIFVQDIKTIKIPLYPYNGEDIKGDILICINKAIIFTDSFSKPKMEGVLRGTIKRKICVKDNFGIYLIKVDYKDVDNKKFQNIFITNEIEAFGNFDEMYNENDFIKVTGYVEYNDKYIKMQFKVLSASLEYQGKLGVISFLKNIPLVGDKKASLIYDTLGDDALKIIKEDINSLNNIKGLNNKTQIREYVIDNYDEKHEVIIAIQNLTNISMKQAIKIFDKYTYDSINIINDNPYCLIYEINGFGFKKADDIAMSLNIDKLSIHRIKAIVYYIVHYFVYEHFYHFGDMYVEYDSLIEEINKRFNNDNISKALIDKALNSLIDDNKLVSNNSNIYLAKIYYAQEVVLENIVGLIKNEKLLVDPKLVLNDISLYEKQHNINLDSLQKDAIIKSLVENILVITGGPGTGKTTIIKLLVDSLLNNCKYNIADIFLLAPTGRATKRLEEKLLKERFGISYIEISTIHRFLGYDKEKFKFNIDNPKCAKVIIIDESSMVDCLLFKNLFNGICELEKLILIGDVDQLPPIGSGFVLKDIIESKEVEVVKLLKNFRQEAGSSIISLALDVNSGEVDDKILEKKKDYKFFECDTASIARLIIINIEKALESNKYSLIEDIQVLIPTYKGINGVNNLNKLIGDHFNSSSSIIYYDKTLDMNYRLKDKVLQLNNRPEKKVMNGDIGFISEVVSEDNEVVSIFIDFNGLNVEYDLDEFKEDISLAYAITIHKAQGSEFKIVILPIDKNYSSSLYTRNSIYTAVTRASEQLRMIGDVRKFIESATTNHRIIKSELKNLIKDKLIK